MTFYRLSSALLPIAVFDHSFSLLFFFPYFLVVTVLLSILSYIFRMYPPFAINFSFLSRVCRTDLHRFHRIWTRSPSLL